MKKKSYVDKFSTDNVERGLQDNYGNGQVRCCEWLKKEGRKIFFFVVSVLLCKEIRKKMHVVIKEGYFILSRSCSFFLSLGIR